MNRICHYCLKRFEINEYRVSIGRGKFCSRRCKDQNQKIDLPKGAFRPIDRNTVNWTTKTCEICKTEKPFKEFRKKAAAVDGHDYVCRDCANEIYRRYKAKNPNKYNARQAVYEALQQSKLVRPDFCLTVMSDGCIGNIEAHHFLGYDKKHWLDIVWLCRRHHLEEHKRKRAGLKET